MCVFALIEGLLFAFFTIELLQEQYESVADNQTYVDDMKEMCGKPQTLTKNMKLFLGTDW